MTLQNSIFIWALFLVIIIFQFKLFLKVRKNDRLRKYKIVAFFINFIFFDMFISSIFIFPGFWKNLSIFFGIKDYIIFVIISIMTIFFHLFFVLFFKIFQLEHMICQIDQKQGLNNAQVSSKYNDYSRLDIKGKRS